MRRVFNSLILVFWVGFYLSWPATSFYEAYYEWWDGYNSICEWYSLCYIIFLFLSIMVTLFINRRKALELIIVAMLTVGFIKSDLTDIVADNRFIVYINPEKEFIKSCDKFNFVQDGRIQTFGFCRSYYDDDNSLGALFNETSTLEFLVVYDTSGDAGNGYNSVSGYHKPDRREWVNAIREYYRNDPYVNFEKCAFFSQKIFENFYIVTFDDPEDPGGFTSEYGLPPYDSRNPDK